MRKTEEATERLQTAVATGDGRQAGPVHKSPLTTVIVPAFNEEKGIEVVLEKLCDVVDHSYEIIVVDDGSTDRTAEVAGRFTCRVISHAANEGKAQAVRTGITAAHGHNVIVIDADDTYPVDVIPQMVRALGEHEMVLTTRVAGRDNIPWFNRVGNYMFRSLIRHLYGFMPADPLTGLYGLKKATLGNMRLDSSGFGAETELAIKAGRMGLKVHEIPIEYRTRIGDAKLRGFNSGYRILQTILTALSLFSPTASFVIPGVTMFGLGLAFMGLSSMDPVGSGRLSQHTFLLAAMLSLAGFHTIVFGIGLDLYASSQRYTMPGLMTRFFLHRYCRQNVGRVGALIMVAGVGVLAWLGYDWVGGGLGAFSRTNLLVIGAFLSIIGLQAGFSSSFLSVFVSNLGGASMNR